MGISMPQLIILLVIIVLVFGTGKLKNIGTDLGNSLKGFKKAMKDDASKKSDEDAVVNRTIQQEDNPAEPVKDAEFEKASYGIVGLETQVGLALSELYHKNILTLEQIIFKMAINPRKILNLSIPSFNIHENANFTILDLNEIWTFDISVSKSKSKNSPFNKKLMTGKAIGIINNQKMYLNNKIFEL